MTEANPRQNVTFPSNGRQAHGYLKKPDRGSGPGLIVIEEWWGLDDHIADIVDRFALETEWFSTFGGNPVACEAALAVLDVIEQELVPQNAIEQGKALAQSEMTKITGGLGGMGIPGLQ